MLMLVLLAACSSGSGASATTTVTSAAAPARPVACSDFFGHVHTAEEWSAGCTINAAVQVATEFKCAQYSHSTDSAPAADLFQNGHGYGFAGEMATSVSGQVTDDPGYLAAYNLCTR